MATFQRYILYLFFFLGDTFLKTKIGFLTFIDLFILINGIYCVVNWSDVKPILKESPFNDKWLIYFPLVFVLSFVGFYKIFPIDIAYSGTYYIVRQGYFLIYIPVIIISLLYSHKSLKIMDILAKDFLIVGLLMAYATFFRFGLTKFTLQFMLLIYSLFVIFFRGKVLQITFSFFIFYHIQIYINQGFSSYSFTFMLILVLLLLNYSRIFIRIFSIRPFILALLAITSVYSIIYYETSLSTIDHNVVFRTLLWSDELSIVSDTYFLGVGYGTTYMSSDLFQLAINVENGNIDAPFRIPSHNSFLTFFYRSGVIGFIIFIRFIFGFIYLDKVSLNKYSQFSVLLFLFVHFNVFFHPIIEVPRGIIIYSYVLFILFKIKQEQGLLRENPSST